jgi:hypothetical protein
MHLSLRSISYIFISIRITFLPALLSMYLSYAAPKQKNISLVFLDLIILTTVKLSPLLPFLYFVFYLVEIQCLFQPIKIRSNGNDRPNAFRYFIVPMLS